MEAPLNSTGGSAADGQLNQRKIRRANHRLGVSNK
jgi:hypothetical protein